MDKWLMAISSAFTTAGSLRAMELASRSHRLVAHCLDDCLYVNSIQVNSIQFIVVRSPSLNLRMKDIFNNSPGGYSKCCMDHILFCIKRATLWTWEGALMSRGKRYLALSCRGHFSSDNLRQGVLAVSRLLHPSAHNKSRSWRVLVTTLPSSYL